MKQINISTKKFPNTFTLVDDTDFEWLNQWKWSAHEDSNTIYAERQCEITVKKIKMHRLILGLTDPNICGDHRDMDGLNNQRHNLRPCTQTENKKNTVKYVNNKSGYKGVSWSKRDKKWCTQITSDGKKRHIGLFTCLIKAAKAYDIVAKELNGEFARLNF